MVSVENSLTDLPPRLRLAQMALENGQPMVALESARAVMGQGAPLPHAYLIAGQALAAMGRYNEAALAFQAAGDIPGAFLGLGASMVQLGRPVDALNILLHVVAREPKNALAWSNLGSAAKDMGDLPRALTAHRKAASLEPNDPRIQWNLGGVALGAGLWEEAWTAWRRRYALDQGLDSVPESLEALFPGADPIALVAEQGLGDTIMLLRFVPQVAAQRPVTLVLPETLHGLIPPHWNVTISTAIPKDLRARHVPLFALAALLAPSQTTLPKPPPYVVDMEAAAAHRACLPEDVPCIGIAWRGNPAHLRDHERSLQERAALALMEACPHVGWVPLRPTEDRPTLAHTGALMRALDAVVSVDSAPAHLAASLGIPTVLLLPANPDGRWGMKDNTTPWYPAMVLLRQRERGAWDEVCARLPIVLAPLLS